MIADENHEGILCQIGLLKRVEYATEFQVNECYRSMIAQTRLANVGEAALGIQEL